MRARRGRLQDRPPPPADVSNKEVHIVEQAIEIRNFTKEYKEFSIRDMNLAIPKGYITGFVGRNGAGKSTALKGILNMYRFGGEIQVLGMDSRKQEQEIKNRLGVVLSEDGFIEDIPVRQFIRIVRPFYSSWQEETFQRLAGRFSLSMDKKVSELSRGMRVKLALAIALSHNAELFLLDEPTAGLDPMVRDEILDIFMELIQDEEKTVFFSTHITSDLDKVADYIVLIVQGEIILNQPKDELLDEHILIQGDKKDLDSACQDALVGWKEHKFGFEGLAKRSKLRDAGRFVKEKPNVEQLMTYYIRGIEHECD